MKASKKASDPLDIVMGVLAVSSFLTIGAMYKGYSKAAASIWAPLLTLAYWKAPARSFPTADEVVTKSLEGKVAIVTGATSGIGLDTARVLALKGAKVYMAARSLKKLEATKARLEEETGKEVLMLECDLNDLDSVQKAAKHFLQNEKKLDILINNAGIMALPERTATKQKLEAQVGVCHVGHVYLTKLLIDALRNAGTKISPSRVVVLSSSAHAYHDMAECLKSDTLETTPYDPWVAYGNAKAANMLFAKHLNDMHDNVVAFSVMPGGIHTGLQTHVNFYKMLKWKIVTPFFFKTTSQGAATSLVCATEDRALAQAGEYWDNCDPNPKKLQAVLDQVGEDAAKRLWDQTEVLIKRLGYK